MSTCRSRLLSSASAALRCSFEKNGCSRQLIAEIIAWPYLRPPVAGYYTRQITSRQSRRHVVYHDSSADGHWSIVRWLKPPVVVLGDGLCLNQLKQLVVKLAVQRAENLEDLQCSAHSGVYSVNAFCMHYRV